MPKFTHIQATLHNVINEVTSLNNITEKIRMYKYMSKNNWRIHNLHFVYTLDVTFVMLHMQRRNAKRRFAQL